MDRHPRLLAINLPSKVISVFFVIGFFCLSERLLVSSLFFDFLPQKKASKTNRKSDFLAPKYANKSVFYTKKWKNHGSRVNLAGFRDFLWFFWHENHTALVWFFSKKIIKIMRAAWKKSAFFVKWNLHYNIVFFNENWFFCDFLRLKLI